MSIRELKSNTYVASTNFPYFLQNWSSCKTVIIEILQQVSVPHFPKNTVPISVSQKTIRHVFLNSEDQTCLSLFFKIHFKGVVLELLAPICKRKKQHPQPWLLSTGDVPPCYRCGCRQTFHQSFPSLVRLSLSLSDAGILLVPVLIWFYHLGGVEMHQG